MSRKNGNASKLDLKLNLSPPRRNESPTRSSASTTSSPRSSCVSSEINQNQDDSEATSMIVVGCPRCLMFVMLAEDKPRCPKCKSTVLLDVMMDMKNNNNT